LAPGEAFFIALQGAAENITFVGEVPQGDAANPLVNPLPGNSSFSMRSSIVPQADVLGSATLATGLLFPGTSQDLVWIFNNQTQAYEIPYRYTLGNRWLQAGGIGISDGPVIEVGTGFFLFKVTPQANVDWVREFSVNN
jgi:hypothetical protein